MKKLASAVLLLALSLGASPLNAQTYLEATGRVGYSRSNQRELIGAGAFDPNRVGYGTHALLIFGRRAGRGLHLGVAGGWERVLDYAVVEQGQTRRRTINTLRALVVTRFWLNDGLWFGEARAGAARVTGIEDDAVRDPVIGAGVGTYFDVGETLAVVLKGGADVLFDSGAPIVTWSGDIGLSFNLGS